MQNPQISVITISYNSEATIEETINSVVNQDYNNVEYIIVDGGSTDKTLQIVNKYRAKINCVISEPDNGISDAFNKGIKRATGDLIGIINSDDLLVEGALRKVAEAFDGKTDVYRGGIIIWNDKNNMKFKEAPSMRFPTIPWFIHVAHQGTFITPQAYDKFGLFKTDFRYMMDLDLLTRFYKAGATMKKLDFTLGVFRLGGMTNENIRKKKEEAKMFVIANGGSRIEANLYYMNLVVQDYLKKILNIFGEDIKRKMRYKFRQ